MEKNNSLFGGDVETDTHTFGNLVFTVVFFAVSYVIVVLCKQSPLGDKVLIDWLGSHWWFN